MLPNDDLVVCGLTVPAGPYSISHSSVLLMGPFSLVMTSTGKRRKNPNLYQTTGQKLHILRFPLHCHCADSPGHDGCRWSQ
ncbi:hypothetical protein K474DRAFT_68761 [Panus rudis PR-1116 ss-1]|nr:hypothetical protein K474DRAFT_68761 [Panus rudis PR-1116 ss-1]